MRKDCTVELTGEEDVHSINGIVQEDLSRCRG